IFETPSKYILFDTGAHLVMPWEESRERIANQGPLGHYLHEIRGRHPDWLHDNKGIFDLGDIAALISPEITKWEVADVPAVANDLKYDFSRPERQFMRIYDVDRAKSFELLDKALLRLW